MSTTQTFSKDLPASNGLACPQQPSMAHLMCKLNGMHSDLATQMTSMGTRLTHVENHQTAMSSRIEKLELAGAKDKEQKQESIKKSHPPGRGGGRTVAFTPRGGSKESDGIAIAVVGGLPADTRRKTLNEAAKSILLHVGGETKPIEAYAPSTHGSVVLVRFTTTCMTLWTWPQQALDPHTCTKEKHCGLGQAEARRRGLARDAFE
eukprot:1561467-Amphidinium_carterae.1